VIHLDSRVDVGNHLQRPECVLCHCSGRLFTADWSGNGGSALIAPDGHTQHIRSRETSWALRPSGIALEPNGSFLIAQLGEIDGEPPPDELRLPGHAGQALDYSQQPPATPRDGIPPELR
jgi:hypothetical protein